MNELRKFLQEPVARRSMSHADCVVGDKYALELEFEGLNVKPIKDSPLYSRDWRFDLDPSLRNNHGESVEWISRQPLGLKHLKSSTENLYEYLEGQNVLFAESPRTSTHVHCNVGDKCSLQVMNLFILYTILGGILGKYCGEERDGNLFCLDARYSEGQLEDVLKTLRNVLNYTQFVPERRYSSLNLCAIPKFNSVEFRGMRGLSSSSQVIEWLNILDELCSYAFYTMQDPTTTIQDISVETPQGFLSKIFSPPNFQALTRDLDKDFVSDSIYEGLRLVQMVCYEVGKEAANVVIPKPIVDYWENLAAVQFQPYEAFLPPQPIELPGAAHLRNIEDIFLNARRLQRGEENDHEEGEFEHDEEGDYDDNF